MLGTTATVCSLSNVFVTNCPSTQLTSFEMTSTDASEVTSSTSLGSFKLTTANTRTGQPQQSVEVGDDKKKSEFVSVNVGSGMICGMTGRAGYLGKQSFCCVAFSFQLRKSQ